MAGHSVPNFGTAGASAYLCPYRSSVEQIVEKQPIRATLVYFMNETNALIVQISVFLRDDGGATEKARPLFRHSYNNVVFS